MQEHLSLTGLVAGLLATIAIMGVALAFLLIRSRSSKRHAAVAEAHYHALVEQSPNGVLVADLATLRIVAGNAALQRSLGYSLD